MNISDIMTHVPLEKCPDIEPIQADQPRDSEIAHFYCNYRYWILNYAETLVEGTGIKEYEDPTRVYAGKDNTGENRFVSLLVNDAGYAFMALVNSYFDMIGQLCGSDGDSYDCYRKWKKIVDPNNPQKRPYYRFLTFKETSSLHSKTWASWDKGGDKPPVNRRVWYGLTTVLYDEYEKFNNKSRKPQTNMDWAKFCHSFFKNARNPVAHTAFPGRLLITRTESPIPWDMAKIGNRNVLLINVKGWYMRISDHFQQYIYRIRFPGIKFPEKDDKELRRRFLKRYKRLLDD